jgi:hypothetical protein
VITQTRAHGFTDVVKQALNTYFPSD